MLRGRNNYEAGKAGMYEAKKVKRYRSAFTTDQINYLEKQFEKCPYIGSATRKEVANLLNIPERAIKIWFQNRRMKEKKEVNNAEYNVDNHNNIANDVKFTKDSLINEHSSPSVNDRQCSLQSTIMKHDDTSNFSHYYHNYILPHQNTNDDVKKETTDNRKPYKLKGALENNIKQGENKSCHLQSDSLMKFHLNNKYNNRKCIDYLQLNKKSVPKSEVMPKTTVKAESLRDRILNMSSTLPQYQDTPEDLSARNLSNVIIPQNHQGNIQFSPAYIPFCNPQDVCISAGNVIWKPVNVMPVIPSNAVPVPVPEKQIINNAQECKCNCNCQSKNRSYDQGNAKTQPQYVIAIPYNTSNNINILG